MKCKEGRRDDGVPHEGVSMTYLLRFRPPVPLPGVDARLGALDSPPVTSALSAELRTVKRIFAVCGVVMLVDCVDKEGSGPIVMLSLSFPDALLVLDVDPFRSMSILSSMPIDGEGSLASSMSSVMVFRTSEMVSVSGGEGGRLVGRGVEVSSVV